MVFLKTSKVLFWYNFLDEYLYKLTFRSGTQQKVLKAGCGGIEKSGNILFKNREETNLFFPLNPDDMAVMVNINPKGDYDDLMVFEGVEAFKIIYCGQIDPDKAIFVKEDGLIELYYFNKNMSKVLYQYNMRLSGPKDSRNICTAASSCSKDKYLAVAAAEYYTEKLTSLNLFLIDEGGHSIKYLHSFTFGPNRQIGSSINRLSLNYYYSGIPLLTTVEKGADRAISMYKVKDNQLSLIKRLPNSHKDVATSSDSYQDKFCSIDFLGNVTLVDLNPISAKSMLSKISVTPPSSQQQSLLDSVFVGPKGTSELKSDSMNTLMKEIASSGFIKKMLDSKTVGLMSSEYVSGGGGPVSNRENFETRNLTTTSEKTLEVYKKNCNYETSLSGGKLSYSNFRNFHFFHNFLNLQNFRFFANFFIFSKFFNFDDF